MPPRSRISRNHASLAIAASLVFVTTVMGYGVGWSQSTYTWDVSGTAAWTDSASWSPHRTTPATDDILVFDGSVTPNVSATGILSETVGQLVLANGAGVSLMGQSPGPVTLTLAGGTGTDLVVPAGTNLALVGATKPAIVLAAGATGLVSGGMLLQSTLQATDAGALVFASGASVNGDVPTPSVHVFGSTHLNSVVFQSGATFISTSGADPFGASFPNSVVTFQTGSLYRHAQNADPSMAGRTYADFELNASGYNGVLTGSGTCSVDKLNLVAGSMDLRLTNIDIHGDVTGGGLSFHPTSAQTIRLNGSVPQSWLAPTAFTSAHTGIQVINAAGVTFAGAVAIAGSLTLAGGGVTLNTLTVNSGATLGLTLGVLHTGAGWVQIASGGTLSGGNTSSYVDGQLRRAVAPGGSNFDFPIGDATTYAPVTLSFPNITAAGTLGAKTTPGDHASIGTSGLDPARSVNRTWTITNDTVAFDPCSATFNFTSGDVDPGADPGSFTVRKFDAPSTWSVTTDGTRNPTSTQAQGITSFSDFQIGDLLPNVLILTDNSGPAANGSSHVSDLITAFTHAGAVPMVNSTELTNGTAMSPSLLQGWDAVIVVSVTGAPIDAADIPVLQDAVNTRASSAFLFFTDACGGCTQTSVTRALSILNARGDWTATLGAADNSNYTATLTGSFTGPFSAVPTFQGTAYSPLVGVPATNVIYTTNAPNSPGPCAAVAPGGSIAACVYLSTDVTPFWVTGGMSPAQADSLAAAYMNAAAVCKASTGVEGPPSSSARFSVFPDPARTVTVSFHVPAAEPVDLSVYDLQGRRLAVLQHGMLPAGDYHRAWDGRSDGGEVMKSGVYFYHLTMGREVRTIHAVRLD